MPIRTDIPPRKVGINCPPLCTFHPDKIGWEIANKLAVTRGRGAGIIVFGRAATELLGRKVPDTSVARHLKHYVEATTPDLDPVGPKPSDIEILDSIIGAGFRNSKNWKPTIRDTLEAMKLKTSMTGNSAFDDLIKLFDVDDSDDGTDEAPIEAPEAVFASDEMPDDMPEETEEYSAGL